MELADTSVWARKNHAGIADWFPAAIEDGEIGVCDMVALELLHSARNATEFIQIEEGLAALAWIEIEARDWTRAREVYRALAERGGGFQRSVKHADLLIAACAERAQVTLVHYDEDYDTIAGITGQSTRWAAPRGSL